MKLINMRRYTGILISCLTISACQSDEESHQAPIDMYVPFSISALPMPNDGYGYDDDLTISLPGEDDVTGVDRENFYRSSDTVYAALDGWGLCTEPLQIPIASLNSNERYPLNPNTLATNVILIKENGTPVETNISSTSEHIQIECAATLTENSTYFLLVNNQIETSDGTQLQADPAFTDLLMPDIEPATLTEQEQLVQTQIQAAKAAAGSSISGEIVYAAQFSTQSSHAISDSIIENNKSAFLWPLVPNKVGGNRSKYDTYTARLTLPFYLPFTEDYSENCLVDEFDPIASCPELYQWMRPEGDSDGHLTRDNSLPGSVPLTITVDVYTPTDWEKNGKARLPVVQFIHGVTANKGTASLMAQDYTDENYIVVAIDMPYHGERIMHDREGNQIGAEINKADFINISSPLTLRGNLNQAVSDNLSLRNALIAAEWADEDNTHLIGHSLGGIVAVMVSEMSQATIEPLVRTVDLSYKTVNFAVPGQGLVNLVLTSDMLGPETEESVKKSPDIQRGIAETVIPEQCDSNRTNEECILALRAFSAESPHNAGVVTQLENDIYTLILPSFKQGIQTSVDSADPANFIRRQVVNQQPTLLIEAVGTCGDTCEVGEYMPDYVVPNNSPINALTGTDPLITALALDDIRDDTTGGTGINGTIRGVIRATTGGHGTYLFAYEGPMDESGAPGTSELGKVRTATETQQIAVRSMIFSDGIDIEIDDHTNIEIEEVQ